MSRRHPTAGDDRRARAERELWRAVEAYHALVYYARERAEVYSGLGLRGGWMGYFASRSAALGPVPADVVTACFYGFAPRMVARALPDAWSFTSPEQVLHARLTVFDRALRRHVGHAVAAPEVTALAELLASVVEATPAAGAPLFAAHRALPRPADPHLALFWATTALRELRGDAHVVALQAARIGPAESNVIMAALGLVPPDQRGYRGWTEPEWDEALEVLSDRGWLDDDGRVTPAGRQRRAVVEDLTDALTTPVWAGLSRDQVAVVTGTLAGLTEPVITSGELPFPNGMGLAPAAEATVEAVAVR